MDARLPPRPLLEGNANGHPEDQQNRNVPKHGGIPDPPGRRRPRGRLHPTKKRPAEPHHLQGLNDEKGILLNGQLPYPEPDPLPGEIPNPLGHRIVVPWRSEGHDDSKNAQHHQNHLLGPDPPAREEKQHRQQGQVEGQMEAKISHGFLWVSVVLSRSASLMFPRKIFAANLGSWKFC